MFTAGVFIYDASVYTTYVREICLLGSSSRCFLPFQQEITKLLDSCTIIALHIISLCLSLLLYSYQRWRQAEVYKSGTHYRFIAGLCCTTHTCWIIYRKACAVYSLWQNYCYDVSSKTVVCIKVFFKWFLTNNFSEISQTNERMVKLLRELFVLSLLQFGHKLFPTFWAFQ